MVQQSSAPSHAPSRAAALASRLVLGRRCLQRGFLFVGGSGLAQAALQQSANGLYAELLREPGAVTVTPEFGILWRGRWM